ncbi:MAG: hypothetical protein K2O69_00415 [Odoribacter sp.]|nr:hypothetical protein [Odoribacter sp.]
MKNILLLFLAGWLPLAAFAQENKEEKVAEKATKQYLPQQGEWSVGVDVIPLLKYAGTIFSRKESELDHLSGTPFTKYGKLNDLFDDSDKTLMPDVSIMGKYFLTDNFAVRANIGLKISSETKRYYVNDDQAEWQNTLGKEWVVDRIRTKRNGVSIMLGGEYRKGSRRVQGVFGAGVLLAFMNDKVVCRYGNELTAINQQPTTTPVESESGTPAPVASRPLKQFNKGANVYTGLTGSAGVEWFVAPKISLGAEMNLSLYYMFGKQTYLESESYNATLGRVEKHVELKSPGNRGFYMATECLGGSLSLNFYF